MGGIKKASSALYDYILRGLFGLESAQHPDRNRFLGNLEKLKGRIGILGNEIRAPVLEAVRQRHETRAALDRFMRMAGANRAVIDRLAVIAAELETLIPPDFLSCFSGSAYETFAAIPPGAQAFVRSGPMSIRKRISPKKPD